MRWPFSIFKHKEEKAVEPYYPLATGNLEDTFLGISAYAPIVIQPRTAYYLNDKNNALGKATGDISNDVADLEKALYDKNTKELVFDTQIVNDLNNPGAGMSGSQFWMSLVESFLLTEEAWVVARGNINQPPKEYVFIRPYDISVVMDDTDGLPRLIETQATKDRNVYERQEINRQIRFIDRTNLNEIIPVIGKISIQDEWRGRSPLTNLFYDIDMNTEGKRHNVSLLKNGMRTSGVMSPKSTGENPGWSEQIVTALSKRLRGFNQGSGNAGNVFVSSRPLDYQALNQSNVDMDYVALLQISEESIFNLYNIPLPLVQSKAMTLDNYKEAIRQYYLRAVYPAYKYVANGLLEGLRDRYRITDNFSFGFSEVDIRAMQPVLVENMKMLNETQAISKNETRAVGGFEPVEGGDTILVSANLVPLGAVSDIEFPETEEPDEEEEQEIEEDE